MRGRFFLSKADSLQQKTPLRLPNEKQLVPSLDRGSRETPTVLKRNLFASSRHEFGVGKKISPWDFQPFAFVFLVGGCFSPTHLIFFCLSNWILSPRIGVTNKKVFELPPASFCWGDDGHKPDSFWMNVTWRACWKTTINSFRNLNFASTAILVYYVSWSVDLKNPNLNASYLSIGW